MKHIAAVVLTVFLSPIAMAGPAVSEGEPPVCFGADFWCASGNTGVCVFKATQRAFLSDASGTYNFTLTEIESPFAPGAPYVYKGSEIELKICTSCADQHGILNVPRLNIKNYRLQCKKLAK